MNFSLTKGPYIKNLDDTSKIMQKVLIALLPIVMFAIFKNGIVPYQNGYITLFEAFKPLLIILLSVSVSIMTEALYILIIRRKTGKAFKLHIMHSYSILPGLILALSISINTPFWLVITGSFVASLIGKMIFGGFGKNKFNPALVGNLFIFIIYLTTISSSINYLNGMEALTKVSTTHNFNTFLEQLFGFMPGPLGTTCNILFIVAMVYLIINKILKWRISAACLSTIFIMTLIIGLMNGMNLWYPIFYLLGSSILYVTIFMASDPVTSPTTSHGQLFYGIVLGILTVVVTYFSKSSSSIFIALLVMNGLVFLFDKLGSRIKIYHKLIIIPIFLILIVLSLVTFYIGSNL